jgi:AcrR family transcriptional regulator
MVEKQTRPGKDSRLKDVRKAARQLFAQHGYEAVTTKMIAETAKISRGLVYRYHGTKDEILSDVLLEFLEEETVVMQKWVQSGQPEAPGERGEAGIIAEYFHRIFEYDIQAEVISFRMMAARQSWSWDPKTENQVYEKVGGLFWPLNALLERHGYKYLDEAIRNTIWAIYSETFRQAAVRADDGEISKGLWRMLFEQSLKTLRL